MIPKPLKPFVALLLEATGNGEVQWNEGAEGAYFASRKDANLHISYFFDHDTGESCYNFRIVRGENNAYFTVMNHEEEYALMRNLYDSISVSAAGGESLVKDLFD